MICFQVPLLVRLNGSPQSSPHLLAPMTDSSHVPPSWICVVARIRQLEAQACVRARRRHRQERDAGVRAEVVGHLGPRCRRRPSGTSGALISAPMPAPQVVQPAPRPCSAQAAGQTPGGRSGGRRVLADVVGASPWRLDCRSRSRRCTCTSSRYAAGSPAGTTVAPARSSKSLSRSVGLDDGSCATPPPAPPSRPCRRRAPGSARRRRRAAPRPASPARADRSPMASSRPLLYARSPMRFLGLDSSTQSLTALVVDTETGEVIDRSVAFGARLPQYKSPNGFLAHADPRVKHSDPLMWVEALDLVLGELRAAGVDLSRHPGRQRRRAAARLGLPGAHHRRGGAVVDERAARSTRCARCCRARPRRSGWTRRRAPSAPRSRAAAGGNDKMVAADRLGRDRTLHRTADPQVREGRPRRLRAHRRDSPGQLVRGVAADRNQRPDRLRRRRRHEPARSRARRLEPRAAGRDRARPGPEAQAGRPERDLRRAWSPTTSSSATASRPTRR